jgi:hypothetical protein
VQYVIHPTLNLCKGVVNHDDFSSESEENLKAFFEERGVADIYRIQRRVDGKLVPTSTLVLAFNRPSLPERIRYILLLNAIFNCNILIKINS